MRTVQTTQLCGWWKNEVGERQIEDLNKDFKLMGLPLKAFYESTLDGWIIKFVKEWDEE